MKTSTLGILLLLLLVISEVVYDVRNTRKLESEKTEMLKLGAEMYRAQVLIKADSTTDIELLDSMFIDELSEVNDTLSKTMKIEFAE